VSYFTLRIIISLMEIIKDIFISTLEERVPVLDSGPYRRKASDSDAVRPIRQQGCLACGTSLRN
jgi:hypothetical protein